MPTRPLSHLVRGDVFEIGGEFGQGATVLFQDSTKDGTSLDANFTIRGSVTILGDLNASKIILSQAKDLIAQGDTQIGDSVSPGTLRVHSATHFHTGPIQIHNGHLTGSPITVTVDPAQGSITAQALITDELTVTSGLAADLSAGGFLIHNLGAPLTGTDAANASYVDAAVASLVAGAGMTRTGVTFNVIAGDTSLLVGADDIIVQLNSSGGLETSSGVRVKLNGVSLARSASGLRFSGDLDSAALTDLSGENVTINAQPGKSILLEVAGILKTEIAGSLVTMSERVKINPTAQLGDGEFALEVNGSISSAASYSQKGAQAVYGISAGALASQFWGTLTYLGGNYVGTGATHAIRATNGVAGTGGTAGEWAYDGNGNYSISGYSDGTTVGANIGLYGRALNSSTINVGAAAAAAGATAGRNVGGFFIAENGANNTGLFVGRAFGPVFSDCALQVTNSFVNTPIAIFQNGATDVVRIEPDGRVNVSLGTVSNGEKFLRVSGTVPQAPASSIQVGNEFATTIAAGSNFIFALGSSFTITGPSYTGSGLTVALASTNSTIATGTAFGAGLGGNFGGNFLCNGATAGSNLGAAGIALNSTGQNIGLFGQAVTATAGKNIGVLASALNSSGTAVGCFVGMDPSDPTFANFTSAALFVTNSSQSVPISIFRSNATDRVRIESDGRVGVTLGTMASGTKFLNVTGTLPSSGTQVGVDAATSIASGTGAIIAVGNRSLISGASYTGAGSTYGYYTNNTSVGTGTGYFVGFNTATGNFGAKFDAFATTAGTMVGVSGAAGQSTGLNIAGFFKGITATTGKNVGLLCVGRNTSGVAVGAYIGMDSADPSANIATSTALLVTNSSEAVPIATFRDGTTDKVRIEDGGQLALASGAAGAPALTHIGDLTTGLNFPSNGQIDLVISGTTGGSWTSSGLSVTGRLTVTAGQLGDALHGIDLTGTLADNAGIQSNLSVATTVNSGSSVSWAIGSSSVMTGAYVGGAPTSAVAGVNLLAGTGASFFNLLGNVGVVGQANATTAGANIGVIGYPRGSSTMNIGVYGRTFGPSPGAVAAGLVGTAIPGNSAITIGLYAGLDGTDPTANLNVSTGALITNSGVAGAPVAIFRVNTSDAVRVEETGQLTLTPPALTDGSRALSITATIPAGTAYQTAIDKVITANNGNTAAFIYGERMQMSGTYTGTDSVVGLRVTNTVPSTGTGWFLDALGNIGAFIDCKGTTAGSNVAISAVAANSSLLNLGLKTIALDNTAGSNVGLVSCARNATGTQLGAYISLDTANPGGNFTSTALLVSNSDQSAPIAIFRQNTTDRVRIESDGRVQVSLGTLATGNTGFIVTCTLPTSGSNISGHRVTSTVGSTTAGSNLYSAWNVLANSSYTGTAATAACRNENNVPGTGTNYFANSSGNYGSQSIVNVTTTGANVGAASRAAGSSGLNIGSLSLGNSGNSAAKNVGIISCATVSATGYGVGLYAGLDTSAPDGNFTSTALLVSNASQTTVPIAIFRQTATDKVRIEGDGRVSISLTTLAAGTNAFAITSTMPTSGSGNIAINISTVVNSGTASTNAITSHRNALSGTYTGASATVASRVDNQVASTGTNYFGGLGGNFAAIYTSGAAGAGANVGLVSSVSNSTTLNVGVFGKTITATTGINVALMAAGRNTSGIAIGAYIGMDSADPIANFTSAALMVTNSDQAVPIAIFRDNTADAVRIEDGGQLSAATGTSGAPSISHIGDLDTGLNFPSNDQVDLVAGGTPVVQVTATAATVTGALQQNIGALQARQQLLATATTANTASFTAALAIPIPTDAVAKVVAYAVGIGSAGTNQHLVVDLELRFTVKNIGGTLTIVNSPLDTISDEPSGWTMQVVGSGTSAQIEVQADAASTVKWTVTADVVFARENQ